ncbi:hypothetical protein [Microvirga sp. Mcv34]|uniref:hypothetical protein n=1 Tax=Microvirga sp. Mcv34 TaxID=2926016 RepID=UPI0021C6AB08|nr:hypothetical protein [Microvirga sp. Mcv34]
MTIITAFEQQAREILHKTEQFLRCTEIACAYAAGTMNSPGAEEGKLLLAAANLETSARNLRQLCTGVHAMRQQAETAQSLPVLTVGA